MQAQYVLQGPRGPGAQSGLVFFSLPDQSGCKADFNSTAEKGLPDSPEAIICIGPALHFVLLPTKHRIAGSSIDLGVVKNNDREAEEEKEKFRSPAGFLAKCSWT